jgi:hypothetical protein
VAGCRPVFAPLFPLATAYLPAQEIERGIVEIVVLKDASPTAQPLAREHRRSRLSGPQGRVVETGLERKLLPIHDHRVWQARAVCRRGGSG